MARSIEIRVPDMGGFKDVAVTDVLVKPGETIQVDTPLVTLETDKATMDVPATSAGLVEKVHLAKGGKVSEGDLIATVSAEAEEVQAEAPKVAASKPEPPKVEVPRAEPPKAEAAAKAM